MKKTPKAKLHFFDRVIAPFSPSKALANTRSRFLLNQTALAYEAAKHRRDMEGWITSSTEPNAEISKALKFLRDRSHDLVQNNPHAVRIVDVWESSAVGGGIRPRVTGPNDKINKVIQEEWNRYAESTDSDPDGRLTVYGKQAQAMRSIVEAGETIARFRYRNKKTFPNLRIPLQIQQMEPDHLDHTIDGPIGANGNMITSGIEQDRFGRRVAYHLRASHPNAKYGNQKVYRVKADEISHAYRVIRSGQMRGVPWLSPVMIKLYGLEQYEEALLMRARLEACIALAITGSSDRTVNMAPDKDPDRPDTMEPGGIINLDDTETVTVINPSGSGAHPDYSQTTLRAIATGANITYEQLTGDLKGATFSSLRASMTVFWTFLSKIQRQLVIPQVCDPIFLNFMNAGALAGLWPADYPARALWIPPARPPVDPVKDVTEKKNRIRTGLMTWSEAVQEQGHDPEQQAAAIAEDNARFDKYKIKLDSDVRKISAAGQEQPSAANSDKGTAA